MHFSKQNQKLSGDLQNIQIIFFIGSLLFADDLLVISESKEGLQNSINKLSDFCDNWQLTVNVKKTKTMVLQRVRSIIPTAHNSKKSGS
jgi:hypothetical protein